MCTRERKKRDESAHACRKYSLEIHTGEEPRFQMSKGSGGGVGGQEHEEEEENRENLIGKVSSPHTMG